MAAEIEGTNERRHGDYRRSRARRFDRDRQRRHRRQHDDLGVFQGPVDFVREPASHVFGGIEIGGRRVRGGTQTRIDVRTELARSA